MFKNIFLFHEKNSIIPIRDETHLAKRRRGDVVKASLCTSQRRRRYISNVTPHDVSMERHQDVSVVRLHGILSERCDDVSRGRKRATSHKYFSTTSQTSLKWNTQRHLIGTLPRRLSGKYSWHTISKSIQRSSKSQIKHPITSLWYVCTTCQSKVVLTLC